MNTEQPAPIRQVGNPFDCARKVFMARVSVVRRGVAVTGVTRGIGRAVAELFHQQGDAVAACSRSARDPALPKRRVEVSEHPTHGL